MLENRYIKIIVTSVFLIILIILSGSNPTQVNGRILTLSLIGVNLLLFIRCILKGNLSLLVLFLFMSTYSIVPIFYYYLDLQISFYIQCFEESLLFFTTQILFLFYISLYLFLKVQEPKEKIISKPNNLGYYISLFFILIITIFSIRGETILSSGAYLSGEAQTYFPPEYAIMFIPLAFVFSSTNIQRLILYIISLIFSIKYMLYGGRVALVQVFLVFYILNFRYIWSVKKTVFIFCVLGIVVLSWGLFRKDITAFSLSSELFGFNSDNASDVYYASIRTLYFIEHGMLNINDRIQAALEFVGSVIVPRSLLSPLANLSTYLKESYPVGGGGLAPVYIYTMYSYPGVILLGYFIGKIFSFIERAEKMSSIYIYSVLVIAMTPRWFAYYPIQLIKLCLIGAILYYALNSLNYYLLISLKKRKYAT